MSILSIQKRYLDWHDISMQYFYDTIKKLSVSYLNKVEIQTYGRYPFKSHKTKWPYSKIWLVKICTFTLGTRYVHFICISSKNNILWRYKDNFYFLSLFYLWDHWQHMDAKYVNMILDHCVYTKP